ncbi:MAG: UDP-N-acetylmuramoyl-L-alanyl-D-glutamate--2,6-diaminopimelate ligase [Proteobacteria bacterium]|nr:UDP-N-acetylmuramoyl-L-alanyl-D-glutamate--2,6-diaminopimelate ligase [Pseudomonadota bacterium]MYJ96995.1 UDP-N-acetylmuramoyl-L-alanyl-D-glutamate--2,6-diaminopimelate ligase [Pseudomonadota bacterium]
MMAAAVGTVMTLGELLGGVPAELSGIEIADLVMDSRQAGPGAAFVAVQGGESHGIEYAPDAAARGAAVVLYEPAPGVEAGVGDVPHLAVANLRSRVGDLGRTFFAPSQSSPRLAGVTGTNGKSTVAYLVAQAQTLRGSPCGYLGTVGAGIPPNLAPQALTTPDCLSLHRALGSLDAEFVAMEVSSHALAQDRIAGLTLDTAVFTNLTRDHLDYHGDMDSYGSAKARLFQWPELRRAVIFVDDVFGAELARELADPIERIEVGLRDRGELRGTIVESTMSGLSVRVEGPRIEATGANEAVLDSPLVGEFNAENLLLALGVLLGWDVPLAESCEALSRCRAPAGRMQVLGGGARWPWVAVDYAHTPAGLDRVLDVLRRQASGDLWCVFGCGGERDRGKRPLMGEAASRFADHIVLTDDNPRGEDPGAIIADIRAGIIDHEDVRIEHDRATAIVETVAGAGPGDVVLVAGKGHELRQTAADGDRDFSDVATVRAALGKLT